MASLFLSLSLRLACNHSCILPIDSFPICPRIRPSICLCVRYTLPTAIITPPHPHTNVIIIHSFSWVYLTFLSWLHHLNRLQRQFSSNDNSSTGGGFQSFSPSSPQKKEKVWERKKKKKKTISFSKKNEGEIIIIMAQRSFSPSSPIFTPHSHTHIYIFYTYELYNGLCSNRVG